MANVLYPDIVIEKRYDSILDTKLDFQQFLTVDYDLAENSGMTKKISTKTVVGDVEDLAMGEGNTETIEVGTSTKDYTVGTTQGRFSYFDEEAMSDDAVVEAGLIGVAEKMVNDFTRKAIKEYEKASLVKFGATWSFDNVVDAIAMMNLEAEDGLFMLISPSNQAAFRKNLKDDLKYVEAFVRSGYIGHVCGAPVYVSKAIPAGEAIIATKEAVTLFLKKETERENQREANTRKNTEYIRKVALVALTDARKVAVLTSASDPKAGYTVLAEAPVDWTSNFANYYEFVGNVLDGKMEHVTGEAAPAFVAGKFYKKA